MSEQDTRVNLRKVSQLTVLALLCIIIGYFFFSAHLTLAIVFISYACILLMARAPLWRVIRGFPGAPTLRLFLRAAIFLLPLPFFGLPALAVPVWGIFAGIGCGMFLLLCQFPALRFALSRDFVAILPPLSREERLREILFPIFAALVQEYFYRGVMLLTLQTYIGFWAVILVAGLFAFEHILHIDATQNFDKYDTLFHILLGLGLGTVLFFSQSLLACILGHLTYNSPAVLEAIRRQSEKEDLPLEVTL